MRELSGGWRVSCTGSCLFAAPDVLLLDEPTNHLSIGGSIWLQHELFIPMGQQDRHGCLA